MTTRWLLAMVALLALAACDGGTPRPAAQEGQNTGFPGSVTAGGGTSGEVLARSKTATGVTPKEAGTPGIPQGAGGTVGGTQLGGTQGSSSIGGTGEKTQEQASKAAPQSSTNNAPPSPTAR